MSSRVYYVFVDGSRATPGQRFASGESYIVRAENDNSAIAMVSEAVKKHFFKLKLAGQTNHDVIKMLTDDIIVEGSFVTEEFPTYPLKADDITAIAVLWAAEGLDPYQRWVSTYA